MFFNIINNMENLETVTGELVPVVVGSAQVAHAQPVIRDIIRRAWLDGQRSEHTRNAYSSDIGQFFAWCDAEDIDVLTALRPHIDRYRRWLNGHDHETRYPSKRKYTASSQARKLTAVSSFYDYAAGETNAVAANPVERVKRPKVSDKSQTNGLNVDQSRKLVAAAIQHGPMAEALTRLLITTGLRVSEVCLADTGDLAWDGGDRVITVTRKGGDREKVLVGPRAADAIDRYLAGRRGPLFEVKGKRINRQQVNYLLRKLTAEAGVPVQISPHSLRHTAATAALNKGLTLRDVQDMLGHKDPRTTNRYDRARQDLQRSPTRDLDDLFDAPSHEARTVYDIAAGHDQVGR
jgi:site-specific recombinase XerD